MFVNRHLIAFVKGFEKKIIETCALQLFITLLASMVSLGIAFGVRMIQGETRILIFAEFWQVFLFIAVVIVARYVLAQVKAVVSEQCGLAIKNFSSRQSSQKDLFTWTSIYKPKAYRRYHIDDIHHGGVSQ